MYVVLILQLYNFILSALVNSIYSFFVSLKAQCSLLIHRKVTDFMYSLCSVTLLNMLSNFRSIFLVFLLDSVHR